jgi:hypothetical protein
MTRLCRNDAIVPINTRDVEFIEENSLFFSRRKNSSTIHMRGKERKGRTRGPVSYFSRNNSRFFVDDIFRTIRQFRWMRGTRDIKNCDWYLRSMSGWWIIGIRGVRKAKAFRYHGLLLWVQLQVPVWVGRILVFIENLRSKGWGGEEPDSSDDGVNDRCPTCGFIGMRLIRLSGTSRGTRRYTMVLCLKFAREPKGDDRLCWAILLLKFS